MRVSGGIPGLPPTNPRGNPRGNPPAYPRPTPDRSPGVLYPPYPPRDRTALWGLAAPAWFRPPSTSETVRRIPLYKPSPSPPLTDLT
jgi:hypothetical protein